MAMPKLEEAESHLAASLTAFETGECRLEAARTHVVYGLLRRQMCDEPGACAHFEKALAQFEASGRLDDAAQVRKWLDA